MAVSSSCIEHHLDQIDLNLEQALKPERRDSTNLYAEPNQTLTFLDWDDTLFPTTYLLAQFGVSSADQWKGIVVTEQHEEELKVWRQALSEYLENVIAFSTRCCIVTNSYRPWVENCIDQFIPSLKHLLNGQYGLSIIYAMEYCPAVISPSSGRGNPVLATSSTLSPEERNETLTKWKFNAMSRETKEFYSQYKQQTWKNILSVGDAPYEYNAIHELVFRRKSPKNERLRLKCLIAAGEPSLEQLTQQLRLVSDLWPSLVRYDASLDVHLESAAGMAELAKYQSSKSLTGCQQSPNSLKLNTTISL